MNLEIYLALAAVLAVVVATSILTVAATSLMVSLGSVFFKPCGKDSPQRNKVFDIELNRSDGIRRDLRRYPSLVLFYYGLAVLLFFLPPGLALLFHIRENVPLEDILRNFGQKTGYWGRAVPALSLSVIVAYALFLLTTVLRLKHRSVRILAAGNR